jgi:hypothetical protein
MNNTKDDLLQAQEELRLFADQREEEREEMQRDALQCRDYFEKMVANQALQIKTLQNELEETRVAKTVLESNFNKTLATKTSLIEEQATSMRSMRESESCQYDKLDSVQDENHALGILNSQLCLRVEAMDVKKREAIEQWSIERVHLRQELARAQASDSRYRSQGKREDGEVADISRMSGSSNTSTSAS